MTHGWCPEMVLLPPGSFLMGSPDHETGRLTVEGPQRVVVLDRPLAVGKFAVTVDQFDAFVGESDHPVVAQCNQWDGRTWKEKPGSFRSPGFVQSGSHPAVCVSWKDAQAYVSWLSGKTGQCWRLLTESEWEYGARAGTVTPFSWGMSIAPDRANYNATTTYGPDGISGPWRQHTLPVESFQANPWGLHQMHGNVWEWVEDCWCRDFHGAPGNSSARQAEVTCEQRVLRGGSWLNGPRGLRSARRHAASPDFRRSDVGFRVARLP